MEVGAGTTGSRRDLSSSFRACPCPTLLRLDVMAQVGLLAQGWVGRGPSWGRGHREGTCPPASLSITAPSTAHVSRPLNPAQSLMSAFNC